MNARRILLMILLATLPAVLTIAAAPVSATGRDLPPGQGALTIIEPDGTQGKGCPLEHTSVKAEISGFVARVEVTQTFHNPTKNKIEAVYTFPLSADGAVDDMVMKVGDRTVRGSIKRREEARRIYEQARDRGHVASLLDQERPNIFTQSVANIMPGEKVVITIRYGELLPYENGAFKFAFPMVVGPRFIPGQPVGRQGTGWAPDTSQVPDASRITPPVTEIGTRAGHDIDLTVSIDAGVPVQKFDSKLHEVKIERKNRKRAVVSLKNNKEIPNRDFVLEYTVAGDEIRSGVLTHGEKGQGYATIIMIPPKRVKPEQIAPKEMIFVIDCSGSQRGKPLEKAKETMKYVIEHMNPGDTFNIIDFNVGARALFETPKENTEENRAKALKYLSSLEANGGTWMGPAIETVCKNPAPKNRLRIVTFMTDGYVGNDFEIISLVRQLRGKSRWFPFGTGNSVNRFLLDNMAKAGGGEVEYILLNSPGEEVAKKFYKRIASPVLTDIALSYDGISLDEVFPEAVSDLWEQRPLIFKAKYAKAGKGTVIIKGFASGKPYEQQLDVTLPEKEDANAGIASIWARAKVDELMSRDWMGIQRGAPKPEIKEEIVKVALAHRIMTQFTSFVAVEETVVTVGGKPTKVAVPVEMPEGVSREGVFGKESASFGARAHKVPRAVYMKANPVRPRSLAGMPGPPAVAPKGSGRGWEFSMQGVPTGRSADAMKPAEKTMQGRAEAKEEASADEATRLEDRSDRESSMLSLKLSKDLRELVKAYREKGNPSELTIGKLKVVEGTITVQVMLTGTTENILQKLKDAGMEIQFKASAGKTVIGTISMEKLEEMARIPEVRFVEGVKSR
jgi:Ca-activated chloride channel family protein